MFHALSAILNLSLTLACGGALSLLLVRYIRTADKTRITELCFIIFLFLREQHIRSIELNTGFNQWSDAVFVNPFVLISLVCAAIAVLFVFFACSLLSARARPAYFIIPCVIELLMLISSEFRIITVRGSYFYIVPVECFFLLASVTAALYLRKRHGGKPSAPLIFFALTAFLSALAVFLDVRCALSWDNAALFARQYEPRNLAESTLYLVFALSSALANGKWLLEFSSIHSVVIPSEEASPTPALDILRLTEFSNHLGLTLRERDILPLLLSDMSNKDISEALYISIGTVKTHSHNIFKKAGVVDRRELEQAAERFT